MPTTATPTACVDTVTRASGLADPPPPGRRRQGPRGLRRRRDRQRRGRRQHGDDERQRGIRVHEPAERELHRLRGQAGHVEQSLPNTGTPTRPTAARTPRWGRWAVRSTCPARPHRQRLRQLPERHEVGHEVRGPQRRRRPGLRRARRAGATIHLFGRTVRGNAVHLHTTTGADGTYSFSAPPGGYTACETVPTGYTQSYPTATRRFGAAPRRRGLGYTVTSDLGRNRLRQRLRQLPERTKSGTKFDDVNANGVKDPTSRASRVSRSTWSGRTAAATPSTCTRRRRDGAYTFSAPPGSYTACETVPPATRSRSRPRPELSCRPPRASGSATRSR